MTEQEWTASEDPAAMLTFVRSLNPAMGGLPPPASNRKLRLFGCACCLLKGRRVEDVDDYEKNGFTYPSIDPRPVSDLLWADGWARPSVAGDVPHTEVPRMSIRASLLRDIFGNPFRPVAMPMPHADAPDCEKWVQGDHYDYCGHQWINPTVLHIARAIYDERAFDRMPVLADALEEAGCQEESLLDHCRAEEKFVDLGGWLEGERDTPRGKRLATHVRGCWVLDLILGKE